jgi:hypothetical protein
MEKLLWISGILGFVANIPYIRGIVTSRKTDNPMKPIRISWFIWLLLDALVVMNSLDMEKSYLEIALPLGYMCGALMVVLFAIPYGTWIDADTDKKGWRRFEQEILILTVSIIGIVIWQFGNPEVSIIAFCIALVISAKPTIQRIWNDSTSEPALPWTMWFIAATLSTIALGSPIEWTLAGSIVTLVYLGMNIPIMYSIYFKK